MNIISICAAVVVTSVLAVMLKKQNAEYSIIISICAVCLIGVYIVTNVVTAVSGITEIFASSGIKTDYIIILLKCVGICFLSEFSHDCCIDASQKALSSLVLLSGRLFILISAFPLFTEFLQMVLGLCGGS